MITRTPRASSVLGTSLLRPSAFLLPQSYICTPCRRELHRGLPHDGQIPKPIPFVPDVPTFLSLIGREMSKHASKLQSWDELFTLTSSQLKERGIDPPRSRRYLLRWREKYRRGEYGIGGDFQYVKDGVAELRVVEVPSLPSKPQVADEQVTITHTPGMEKLVLNVPNGSETYVLKRGQTTADLRKPKGYKVKSGYIVTGKAARPMKGARQSGATVTASEGLWEHTRGHKVHGGERRRAEVLHKLRVEANKAGR